MQSENALFISDSKKHGIQAAAAMNSETDESGVALRQTGDCAETTNGEEAMSGTLLGKEKYPGLTSTWEHVK